MVSSVTPSTSTDINNTNRYFFKLKEALSNSKQFANFLSVNNLVELADEPILHVRWQGQAICFVSSANRYQYRSTSDSLRAWTIRQQQMTNIYIIQGQLWISG